MADLVEIDGSYGEGGGQVLRTSLTLAVLTGRPVRITRIRAGRTKPGLAAQHLQSVEATRTICNGAVEGAKLGSQEITLVPGEVVPGQYSFEIGTAGATSLVLQTLALPLALAAGPSELVIRGGTHVAWSPSFHYLRDQWCPALALAGLDVQVEIRKAGYYPKGGGELVARIFPRREVKLLKLHREAPPAAPRGAAVTIVSTRLPTHVAERQAKTARGLLEKAGLDVSVEIEEYDGVAPGTATHVRVPTGACGGMFTSLGERGLPAEKVAARAAGQAIAFAQSDAAIDKYLADQLILPLALAEGTSEFDTHEITEHLVTNADIVSEFLSVDIDVVGDKGSPGRVTITPADRPA
ncbi:MAG: RNA 3'-phosphate cyclase [Verrucomicrobia bacterium]|nr:RNA 3'-phosphate cyclase [Verrucomicrobiota bacterium]